MDGKVSSSTTPSSFARNSPSSFNSVVPAQNFNNNPQWQGGAGDMYTPDSQYPSSYITSMPSGLSYQQQNQFQMTMQQSFSQSASNMYYASHSHSQSFSSSQSYGSSMNSGVSYEEEASYQYMGGDPHGGVMSRGFSAQQGFSAQSGFPPQGYASQQAYALQQGGYGGSQPMAAQFERHDMQFGSGPNGQLMYQNKGMQYGTDGNTGRFASYRNAVPGSEENGLGFSPRGLPIMDGVGRPPGIRPGTPNMRSPSNSIRPNAPGSIQSYSPRPAGSYPSNLEHQNSLGSNPDLSSPRSALSSPASVSIKSPHPSMGSPRASLSSPMSTSAPALNSPLPEIGAPVGPQRAIGRSTPDGNMPPNQQFPMRQPQYPPLPSQNDFNSNYPDKKNVFSSKNLDGSIAAIEMLTERHLGSAMQDHPNFALQGKVNGPELCRSQSVPAGHGQPNIGQEKFLEKQLSEGSLLSQQENSNSGLSNLGNNTPLGAGSSAQSPRSIQGKQDGPIQSPEGSWTSFNSPPGQNSPMTNADGRPFSQESLSNDQQGQIQTSLSSASPAQNSPLPGGDKTFIQGQTQGQGQQLQIKEEQDVKPFTPMSMGSQPSQSPKSQTDSRPFSRGSSAMDSSKLTQSSPGTPSHSMSSPLPPSVDQSSPYMPHHQQGGPMGDQDGPFPPMFHMNQSGMGSHPDMHGGDLGLNPGMNHQNMNQQGLNHQNMNQQGMNQMNQGMNQQGMNQQISQSMMNQSGMNQGLPSINSLKMNAQNDSHQMGHPQNQYMFNQQQQYNQQQFLYNQQQQRQGDYGMFHQGQTGSGGGIPPISQMLSPPDMPPRWSNSPLVDLPSMGGPGGMGGDLTSNQMDSSLPNFSTFPDDNGEYDFNEDDLDDLNSEWNQHYQQFAFNKRKAPTTPKGAKRKRKLKAKDGDCNQVVSLDLVDIIPPEGTDIASRFLLLERQLCEELRTLKFRWPVTYIYNPIDYAWGAHTEFVRKYLNSEKKILFIGMNPGPFGMAQSGVPFGEVNLVRDWLDVHGEIVKPTREHPKKPILGFDCTRKEVSGARFWGFFKRFCGIPEVFFRHVFVHNLCPLLFMNDNGRNLTPPDLPIAERRQLNEICHRNLCQVVRLLNTQIIVGIGKYAQERAKYAMEEAGLGAQIRVESILHPSPANPSANKGWEESAIKQLEELGLLHFIRPDNHNIS